MQQSSLPDDVVPGMLPIRVKRTPWAIRVGHVTHPFESLSQMAKWLSSNPIEDNQMVALYRREERIYTGAWDETCVVPDPVVDSH